MHRPSFKDKGSVAAILVRISLGSFLTISCSGGRFAARTGADNGSSESSDSTRDESEGNAQRTSGQRDSLVADGVLELPSGMHLSYQVVDGYAVVFGDIALSKVEDLSTVVRAYTSGFAAYSFFNEPNKWPNGIVPYVFDATVTQARRADVMRVIEYLNGIASWTGVKLAERSSETGYVKLVATTSNFSYLGTNLGEQALGFSDQCGFGCLLHLFGHVLNLDNEHCRPDRDRYITIDLTNVQAEHQSSFELWPPELAQYLSSESPYDFDSIMHAGAFHAAIDPTRPTVVRKDGGTLKAYDEKIGLSPQDIIAIGALYKSEMPSTAAPSAPPPQGSTTTTVSEAVPAHPPVPATRAEFATSHFDTFGVPAPDEDLDRWVNEAVILTDRVGAWRHWLASDDAIASGRLETLIADSIRVAFGREPFSGEVPRWASEARQGGTLTYAEFLTRWRGWLLSAGGLGDRQDVIRRAYTQVFGVAPDDGRLAQELQNQAAVLFIELKGHFQTLALPPMTGSVPNLAAQAHVDTFGVPASDAELAAWAADTSITLDARVASWRTWLASTDSIAQARLNTLITNSLRVAFGRLPYDGNEVLRWANEARAGGTLTYKEFIERWRSWLLTTDGDGDRGATIDRAYYDVIGISISDAGRTACKGDSNHVTFNELQSMWRNSLLNDDDATRNLRRAIIQRAYHDVFGSEPPTSIVDTQMEDEVHLSYSELTRMWRLGV